MIPLGTLAHATCRVPDCGQVRCDTCGERMACVGPEPAPRCDQHPTCLDCADSVVHCRECGEVLRQAAEDRAEQAAYDLAREAG